MTAKTRHLTSDELADRLGLDPGTLTEWRRDGRGPAYIKDGEKFVRYREADVIEWEQSHLITSQ